MGLVERSVEPQPAGIDTGDGEREVKIPRIGVAVVVD
jgi:hypothetical protein